MRKPLAFWDACSKRSVFMMRFGLSKYRSLQSPSGREFPKSVRESLLGPFAPGVPKVFEIVSKRSLLRLRRLFGDCFGSVLASLRSSSLQPSSESGVLNLVFDLLLAF